MTAQLQGVFVPHLGVGLVNVRVSVKNSVTASSANHPLMRLSHEWLLAGLTSTLLTGCVSESGRNVIDERTDLRRSETMQPPDIVRREGFLVMGTVTRRQPGTERPETFVSAWNEFETYQQRVQRHSVNSKYYGVSFAASEDGSFDYLTGMAVQPGVETPEGLEVRVVPAAVYAVFTCPIRSIGQTYRYIFGEWRAKSGYATDATAPAFEEYPPGTDPNAPVLLHIPIREDHAK